MLRDYKRNTKGGISYIDESEIEIIIYKNKGCGEEPARKNEKYYYVY